MFASRTAPPRAAPGGGVPRAPPAEPSRGRLAFRPDVNTKSATRNLVEEDTT